MFKSPEPIHGLKQLEIVIFGTGAAGQRVFDNLNKDLKIIGFADNDVQKQNTLLNGLPVFSPQQLEATSAHVVVASEFYEQIRKSLLEETALDESRISQAPASAMTSSCFGKHHVTGICILETICKGLSEAKLDYHIDAGTLLGLYRDEKLIPWDDDLDIAVDSSLFSALKNKMSEIKTSLENVTQEMWGLDELTSEHTFGNVLKGKPRSLKLACTSNDDLASVDFFIKYRCTKHSDYCLASRGIRMPANLSESTFEKVLAGIAVRLPNDTEGYLGHHYGKDWRTPNPNWSLQDLDNSTIFYS